MELDKELSGILVVSLEQAVAAPYCGLLLASAGARVIKVERPEGDFARSYDTGADGDSAIFAWLNRGKESIALNLKDTKDKKVLEKIESISRLRNLEQQNLINNKVINKLKFKKKKFYKKKYFKKTK